MKILGNLRNPENHLAPLFRSNILQKGKHTIQDDITLVTSKNTRKDLVDNSNKLVLILINKQLKQINQIVQIKVAQIKQKQLELAKKLQQINNCNLLNLRS